MNTVENIRSWFLTCPVVSNAISTFGTDYIGADATECSIYSMPSALSYTEDITGKIEYDARQRLNFIFALKAPYGADTAQNLDNLKLFSDLQAWMYQQNELKNFPQIVEGEVVSIVPVRTQYADTATVDSAVYQMQVALTYWITND